MFELIPLVDEALNSLAHLSAGLATGDILRERLDIKETEQLKRNSDKIMDAGVALYQDIDLFPLHTIGRNSRLVTSIIGNHRGYLHIPYVDGPIGFAVGCGYCVAKNARNLRNLNYSRILKHGAVSAASALTHPVIDLLSGGGVPYLPNESLSLHNYGENHFSIAFHSAVIGISLLALYCSHRKRK